MHCASNRNNAVGSFLLIFYGGTYIMHRNHCHPKYIIVLPNIQVIIEMGNYTVCFMQLYLYIHLIKLAGRLIYFEGG